MELDNEYKKLVEHILKSEEFINLKKCEHHGITRFDHSLKVSYQAYKFAKKHNMDYKSVAIGGLLHDFFDSENVSLKEKFISTFTHPLKAEINALEKFNVNSKESDIIRSHMFPLNLVIPKHKESWLVSLVDKAVATYEFYCSYGKPYVYRFSNIYIFIFLFLR